MNTADKLHLGKMYVDYQDAIESTTTEISQTTEMMKAVIEGLRIADNRPQELSMYQSTLQRVMKYAEEKGIELEELIAQGEAYKTLSVSDYITMKKQVTIKEELDSYLLMKD